MSGSPWSNHRGMLRVEFSTNFVPFWYTFWIAKTAIQTCNVCAGRMQSLRTVCTYSVRC